MVDGKKEERMEGRMAAEQDSTSVENTTDKSAIVWRI